MPDRRLAPEERALWQRVASTVRPIAGRAAMPAAAIPEPSASGTVTRPSKAPAAVQALPKPGQPRANTLDGSWDRRLKRGTVEIDMAVDLHGHTLASAHAELDAGLAHAVAAGVRVLLLITGRPPRDGRGGRGAIRGEVLHWLADSRFAGRIAAIRHAHPRHGGGGALYLILKRPEERRG